MKIVMDVHDLMLFAEAAVTAQKAVELEMQRPDSSQPFHRAPWDYKWGIIVDRALGAMPKVTS